MTEGVSYELSMFADRVGEQFQVVTEAGLLPLELIEAAGREDEATRQFSLVFHDAQGSADRFLAQSIYAIKHETLGELSFFLVPIGPDFKRKGMNYEAAFHLLHESVTE